MALTFPRHARVARILKHLGPPDHAFSGVPRRLYEGQFMFSPNSTTSYGLAPDGKRFLRVQPVQPLTRIDIVLNWREELKRQVK